MVEIGPFKSIIYGSNLARQIGSWYVNHVYSVDITSPWVVRGGLYYYGSESYVSIRLF